MYFLPQIYSLSPSQYSFSSRFFKVLVLAFTATDFSPVLPPANIPFILLYFLIPQIYDFNSDFSWLFWTPLFLFLLLLSLLLIMFSADRISSGVILFTPLIIILISRLALTRQVKRASNIQYLSPLI